MLTIDIPKIKAKLKIKTSRELGLRLGMSKNAITLMGRNPSQIKLETIEKFWDLGISPTELFSKVKEQSK